MTTNFLWLLFSCNTDTHAHEQVILINWQRVARRWFRCSTAFTIFTHITDLCRATNNIYKYMQHDNGHDFTSTTNFHCIANHLCRYIRSAIRTSSSQSLIRRRRRCGQWCFLLWMFAPTIHSIRSICWMVIFAWKFIRRKFIWLHYTLSMTSSTFQSVYDLRSNIRSRCHIADKWIVFVADQIITENVIDARRLLLLSQYLHSLYYYITVEWWLFGCCCHC